MWYFNQVSRHLRNATVNNHQMLSISIGKCNFYLHDYDLHPITYLLPSYAASITHLTLFLPPAAHHRLLSIQNQLTRLVYVAFVNTASDGSEDQQFFDMFEGCPTLQTFYVVNFGALADVVIPKSVKDLAVRHYNIFQREHPQLKRTEYGLRTYGSHLQSWTNLESLCIDISGRDIPDIAEPCTLLPNLNHLAVHAYVDAVIPTFLKFVNTPLLTSLSLSSMAPTSYASSDATRFFGSIDTLVVRSGCILESLELDLSVRTNVGVLLTTLDGLPTLTHLAIRRRGSSRVAQWLGDTRRQQEVLSASRPNASDAGGESNPRMLLPSLKTLTLDAEPHHAPGLPRLASWIELRAPTAPLKRVDIIWRTRNGVGYGEDKQVLETFVDRVRLVGGVVVTGVFMHADD
ncbi:hypothetical protein CYLTODRAFT_413822 [Cylindrobasidium torrendii FP15055 ss-10]|uniref:F-box domain-containing protein n=1 Tax=Cylindrobasidium torrendii FP15055 ss-10 TaxID=1314674 RepID=A0A0D7B0K3_9AGAR|nr:hypothetical protein CYLTODRAFT_413822 [Cylindrobasidium torrendii FP15055 ss-10]